MLNKQTDIVVREAIQDDSQVIFEWRNDKLTRQMSHSSDTIEWQEHLIWYRHSLASPTRLLLICQNESAARLSFVSFDMSESSALVSINLNPDKRGKGLAKPSLIASIDFMAEQFHDVNTLFAEIKENNRASQKTFMDIGFEKYKLEGQVGFYQKLLR